MLSRDFDWKSGTYALRDDAEILELREHAIEVSEHLCR